MLFGWLVVLLVLLWRLEALLGEWVQQNLCVPAVGLVLVLAVMFWRLDALLGEWVLQG
jgi:hypothetical protein